jgi:hypothetical protein
MSFAGRQGGELVDGEPVVRGTWYAPPCSEPSMPRSLLRYAT